MTSLTRRAALVAAAATLAVLASSGPALAASVNGTQHSETSQCYPEPALMYTLCVDDHTDTHTTENANNLSTFIHSDTRYVFTAEPGSPVGACVQTRTEESTYRALIKRGEYIHEWHYTFEPTSVALNCGGVSVECASITRFHYSNGEVQFFREHGGCILV
jgi:hypothetical protein